DVEGGSENDTISISATGTVTVNGDSGNDTITVNSATTANVNGGTGNDILNVYSFGAETSTVDGGDEANGLGQDTINLSLDANSGTDTILIGTEGYTALQAIDSAAPTKSSGALAFDTINYLNFKVLGAGAEDALDLS